MTIYEFFKNKGVFETIKKGTVIDIGSGDGREGKLFQENGFKVLNLDKKNGTNVLEYKFLPEVFDIAIAKNSLPFMGTKQLYIIEKVYESLKKGGYFYGTVFGEKDPWAQEKLITPLDFKKLRKKLVKLGFKILWVSEEEGLGRKIDGGFKNWHIFKFLITK